MLYAFASLIMARKPYHDSEEHLPALKEDISHGLCLVRHTDNAANGCSIFGVMHHI